MPFAKLLDRAEVYVPVAPACYVTIANYGDARLTVFSDSLYGPYRGSMLSVVPSVPPPRELDFGDAFGIYFRYWSSTNGWFYTLAISLWYPIAACFVAPSAWLYQRSRMRESLCPACRYDLRGTPDAEACPECGCKLRA